MPAWVGWGFVEVDSLLLNAFAISNSHLFTNIISPWKKCVHSFVLNWKKQKNTIWGDPFVCVCISVLFLLFFFLWPIFHLSLKSCFFTLLLQQPTSLSAQQQQLQQLQLLQQQLLQQTELMQQPAQQQQAAAIIDSNLLSQIQTLTNQLLNNQIKTLHSKPPEPGFNKVTYNSILFFYRSFFSFFQSSHSFNFILFYSFPFYYPIYIFFRSIVYKNPFLFSHAPS